jgi:hypothetical protein
MKRKPIRAFVTAFTLKGMLKSGSIFFSSSDCDIE